MIPKEPRTEEEEFQKSLRKLPDLRRYLPGLSAVFFFFIFLLISIGGSYLKVQTWRWLGWLN